ncbi:MFS transporter, DHA2 family, multidrug resistance protein [Phyllobacterium sp. CL33Tsu]|nr:MFS transporter, DHA2 family, multidrug resistance protein [Phyllobacterium sp. CL33Tsu]
MIRVFLVAVALFRVLDFLNGAGWLLRDFVWWGLGCLSVLLVSLDSVLACGSRGAWLALSTILFCCLVVFVVAVMFFFLFFTAAWSMVAFFSLVSVPFSFWSALLFVFGMGFCGLAYLSPVSFVRVCWSAALVLGAALFVWVFLLLLSAPLSVLVSGRMDSRVLLVICLLVFGWGALTMSPLSAFWVLCAFLLAQLLRGCSVMLFLVGIALVVLVVLPVSRLLRVLFLLKLSLSFGGAVWLSFILLVFWGCGALPSARVWSRFLWGAGSAQELLSGMAWWFSARGLLCP